MTRTPLVPWRDLRVETYAGRAIRAGSLPLLRALVEVRKGKRTRTGAMCFAPEDAEGKSRLLNATQIDWTGLDEELASRPDWQSTPPERRHRKPVNLSLAPATVERLAALAEQTGQSRAAVVDAAVAAYRPTG